MFFWNSYGLQDAMSPVMEEFIYFHDFTMIILIYATVMVGGVMVGLMYLPWVSQNLIEGQKIESIWTSVPAIFLMVIGTPSLFLLYSLDESSSTVLSMKVIGHQWFWEYEMTDFWSSSKSVIFDSYMIPSSDCVEGEFRLLDVDNRPCLPYLTQIRALVSSSDVLHSWAVPSLGVKMDAVPGRLNQTKFMSYRPGVAYGQCSEICGSNHSFMPIVVEFISTQDFLSWVMNMD